MNQDSIRLKAPPPADEQKAKGGAAMPSPLKKLGHSLFERKYHIHLVLEMLSKVSESSKVGFLKGKSATQGFSKFKGIRKTYWGQRFGPTGYL